MDELAHGLHSSGHHSQPQFDPTHAIYHLHARSEFRDRQFWLLPHLHVVHKLCGLWLDVVLSLRGAQIVELLLNHCTDCWHLLLLRLGLRVLPCADQDQSNFLSSALGEQGPHY